MKLEVNDLCFHYSSTSILHNIKMRLDSRELIALVGPNGVGKSTLLKCIDRILSPSHGSIILNEQNLKQLSQMDIAKKIGFVHQKSNQIFSFNVFDVVLMGRRPHMEWRCSKKDRLKALNAIKLAGIDDIAMKSFNELSGGQQQKVMIARVLAQETDILLLDEPTSNLDVKRQLEVMNMLKNLVMEKSLSVIVSIHDLNLAARYADKIVLLKDGRVIEVGEPEFVLTENNIALAYGVKAVVKNEGGKPYIIPVSPM